MTPLDVVTVGVVLGLGALLQSAVGFGMALIAVPLLVLAGNTLPASVAMVLGGALVQTAYGTYIARREVVWRRAFSLAAIQWVTLLAGVAGMSLIARSDPVVVKQAVGVIVIVIVTAQLVLRPVPRQRLAPGWTLVAGGSSGILAGLVGMGGPPLVLYALAHPWSRDGIRAFLWSQFLLVLPVLAVLLVFRFGFGLLAWLGIGAAMAPVIWLGSRGGLILTERWERKRLQLASIAVLYAIGLTGVFGSYLNGR